MPAATQDLINQEIASGRYRVERKLGEGGMGAVYCAHDKTLGTQVVVKVPHALMMRDRTFASRFSREIRSLVNLTHPHIVKIVDAGQHDQLPFAVMQFLGGGSLEDRRASADGQGVKQLEPSSLSGWLSQVAGALDFVHSRGFVHRDVKPGNILFDEYGNAYLGDFGIAKVLSEDSGSSINANLTGAGMVVGTFSYMAPEVLMGQVYDGRADQYALAVMIFEMLAGQRPFEATSAAALVVQQATKKPPVLRELRPELPAALSAALERGLQKDPEHRYASCRELANAVLAAIGTSARPPARTPNTPQRTLPEGMPAVPMQTPQYGQKTVMMPQHEIGTAPVALMNTAPISLEEQQQAKLKRAIMFVGIGAGVLALLAIIIPIIVLSGGSASRDADNDSRRDSREAARKNERRDEPRNDTPRADVPRREEPKPTAVAEDLKRLQGRWKIVQFQQNGAYVPIVQQMFMVIEGNVCRAVNAQGVIVGQDVFEIDPSQTPKVINSRNINGEFKNIYSIEGDRLMLLCNDQPNKPRGTAFATAYGDERTLFVLERDQ